MIQLGIGVTPRTWHMTAMSDDFNRYLSRHCNTTLKVNWRICHLCKSSDSVLVRGISIEEYKCRRMPPGIIRVSVLEQD